MSDRKKRGIVQTAENSKLTHLYIELHNLMIKYFLATASILLSFSTFVYAADNATTPAVPKTKSKAPYNSSCEQGMSAKVVLISPGVRPRGIVVTVQYNNGQLEKLAEFKQGTNNIITTLGQYVCMSPNND